MLGNLGDSSLEPVIRPRSHGYPHWSLPSCATTAKAWLRECETSHECLTRDSGFVPHRLLELRADSCASGVKLVEVEGATQSVGYAYACLSYCWGQGTHHCMTTDDTLERHKREIAWSNVPTLFQDVIKFVRAMGIRYLWIDSVCIIQGNTEDWEKEAGLMAQVYSNSVMTIATTRASDVTEGLFSAPPKQKYETYYRPRKVTARYRGQDFHLFAYNCYVHSDLTFPYDRPLLQRAWVFQERLLSPRVLHFCLEELQWECRAGTICQCAGLTFHSCEKSIWNQNSSRDSPSGGPPVEHAWHKIVQRYSTLKLTFGKDRLPAISGAAKQTEQFRAGETYLAGIWKCDLPWALGWISRAETLGTRPGRADWFAPTWSWACVNGNILWAQWSRAPDKQYASLTGRHQAHMAPEMMGRVCHECWISVSGLAATAWLKFNDEGNAEDQSSYSLHLRDGEFGVFLADFRLFELGEFCVPNPRVRCLLLYEVDSAWTFLVLCPTKGSHETYQRIGVVSYRSEVETRPQSFFECASDHSFIIV